MKDYVVAIDLGSATIKAGLGHKSHNGIEIVAIYETPSYGIKRGMINNTQKVSESIKKAVEGLSKLTDIEKFEYFPVVVGVNGKNIFTAKSSKGMISTRVNKPIDDNDIKRVIEQAKIGAVIPNEHEILYVHPNVFHVDSLKNIKNPIGMYARRLEVEAYVVSVESLILKNIRAILNNAGISNADIYLNVIAQKYGILDEEDTDSLIIVDIGKHLTTLSLWDSNGLDYVTVYEQGIVDILSEISKEVMIPSGTCESILKSIIINSVYDIDYEDQEIEINDSRRSQTLKVSSRLVYNIIESVVSKIFSRIYADIEKTGFLKRFSTPSLYISGGIAEIKGIEVLAENIFNLPVYIAKVSLKVNNQSYLGPRYITLAGLIKLYFDSPGNEIKKNNKNKSFIDVIITKLREMLE
ncbi:MAG: cell division protein FtsA [candidate division WOR-3 bacterium]|nr:cell division protein FtsA [candidate division WOR-3 bacterium]MCX7948045.1 cell division protein FtsA [candidate division WOR-3 bacterium]MDW8151017.1 cell division protein FtsA [candidate division WOR-3 bacterium]